MKIYLIKILLLLFIGCKMTKSESQIQDVLKSEITAKFPKYIDYVSDFDKVFTNEQKGSIIKTLRDYETKTSNEIAVISISENLNENNFDHYALELSNHWGVGDPNKNNGLTIVFSKKLRKIRICTGRGTEKILSDPLCEKILNEKILPEFKKENYYSGISNGINEFIKLWK